jgi:hypothetical protein
MILARHNQFDPNARLLNELRERTHPTTPSCARVR